MLVAGWINVYSGLKDCQVTVPSQHTVLYTWDLPMGVREIVWSCGNKRNVKNNLSEVSFYLTGFICDIKILENYL